MIDFLFDLPLWTTGLVVVVSLCLFAIGGLFLVRQRVLPRLRVNVTDSEFIGTMVQCVMIFYGLATALAALYRDISGYPEPIRPHLQNDLRKYTRYVIEEAWPLQQRGHIPGGGVEQMNRFQDKLIGFEPDTGGQAALHAETLRGYNHFIEARRLRLDAVGTRLPSVMWAVIVVGAAIGLSATFFFKVEDARLHRILVTLLATFIGLVIFMILVLDRPFQGDLGISAQPYQLIYDQLMKP